MHRLTLPPLRDVFNFERVTATVIKIQIFPYMYKIKFAFHQLLNYQRSLLSMIFCVEKIFGQKWRGAQLSHGAVAISPENLHG